MGFQIGMITLWIKIQKETSDQDPLGWLSRHRRTVKNSFWMKCWYWSREQRQRERSSITGLLTQSDVNRELTRSLSFVQGFHLNEDHQDQRAQKQDEHDLLSSAVHTRAVDILHSAVITTLCIIHPHGIPIRFVLKSHVQLLPTILEGIEMRKWSSFLFMVLATEAANNVSTMRSIKMSNPFSSNPQWEITERGEKRRIESIGIGLKVAIFQAETGSSKDPYG